jgi:hypothetical protein
MTCVFFYKVCMSFPDTLYSKNSIFSRNSLHLKGLNLRFLSLALTKTILSTVRCSLKVLENMSRSSIYNCDFLK